MWCVNGRFAVRCPQPADIQTRIMNARNFRLALRDLGLTQTEAADLLGLSRRTVVYYAGGKPIPAPVAILVNLMLADAVSREYVEAVGR
jgi:DNA-binding XRE family transcriptional regulator